MSVFFFWGGEGGGGGGVLQKIASLNLKNAKGDNNNTWFQ